MPRSQLCSRECVAPRRRRGVADPDRAHARQHLSKAIREMRNQVMKVVAGGGDHFRLRGWQVQRP